MTNILDMKRVMILKDLNFIQLLCKKLWPKTQVMSPVKDRIHMICPLCLCPVTESKIKASRKAFFVNGGQKNFCRRS